MKKKKAFENWRQNAIHLTFPNGNLLSTTWNVGTYSDNYDAEWSRSGEFTNLPSNTVEIMFDCGEKLKKRILKKYNEGDKDPIPRLSFSTWLEIVNLLEKEKKPVNSLPTDDVK